MLIYVIVQIHLHSGNFVNINSTVIVHLSMNAIRKQFQPLEEFLMSSGKIHVGSQLHDNRPCYVTLKCDSGLMCLDWRHICDGDKERIHPILRC